METCTNNKIFKSWPLGWKARIGLLVPSQEDGYGSYEFQMLCPDGVVVLSTRVKGGKLTMEMLRRMREDAIYAAELLAAAEPDVISYEATAAGFVLGVEGDRALIKEIEDKTGIKATSGASAASEASRFLGIERMVLFAPTVEEITLKSVEYLQDSGFEVCDHESIAIEGLAQGRRMSPWEVYGQVMKLYRRSPHVDGIFVSGGCFRTLEMIEALEKETGLPVVTTVVANMWRCLQLAGVKDLVRGFGRLLEQAR